jgi:hypothetical protein
MPSQNPLPLSRNAFSMLRSLPSVVVLAACSTSHPAGDSASVPSQVESTLGAAPAAAPSDIAASAELERPLELDPPRTLAGTGIRVALPKGARRFGRELTFRLGRQPDAITLTLANQATTQAAKETLERAVQIFGKRKDFTTSDPVYELEGTPGRFAAFGVMSKGRLGNIDRDMPGLLSFHQQEAHGLFLLAAFPDSERKLVERVAQSLEVDSKATLHPAEVAGLNLEVPAGYAMRRDQLHPIIVLPEGATFAPGQPSLDIRVAGPNRTAKLLEDMVWIFGGDPSTLDCKLPPADAPQATPWHQTCSFPGRGPFRVRVDAMEDAYGGLVAAVTTPDGAATHEGAFTEMVENLELVAPPEL